MPPDGTGPRLFFYVQHLLGIGHLHRAARIAKALSADGFEVRLVLGGPPTPSLDVGDAAIVQLPPVKVGPDGFSRLVHLDGRAFEAADAARRARLLLGSFDDHAPDILLTEAFPFGRRQMRFELLPLLDHARARSRPPLIAASVRDILQRDKRAERVAETVELIARFYDRVLVHGDPSAIRLEASFPPAGVFADKIAYTGIVAPDRPVAGPALKRWGVVVSVGGGAVGSALLKVAIAARPMTRLADRPWLVITGPNLPDPEVAALVDASGGGVRVERFVPELAGTLAQAEVSISQAGYNTVADILVSDCRAVLVPFAGGGETEQSDRAAVLQARGRAVTVPETVLAPGSLAAAIDRALDGSLPDIRLDLDGARATSRILRDAGLRRPPARPSH